MQQYSMLAHQVQKSRASEAAARAACDEASRERWERIDAFIGGMFDVGREIGSWYDVSTFVSYYTAVYEFCTVKRGSAQPAGQGQVYEGGHQQFQYGEQLYDLLVIRLSEEFEAWCQTLSAADEASFEGQYARLWSRFKAMSEHLEAVFAYLERFWVERKLESSTSASSGECCLYVRPLMYVLWAEHILKRHQDKLLAILVKGTWSSQEDLFLGDLVESYKMLSVPIRLAGGAKRESGVKLFEAVLLPHYCSALGTHLQQCYSEDAYNIHGKFLMECERAKRLLGSETVPLVKETLKKSLLEPALRALRLQFEGLLANELEPIPDLKAIFDVFALRRSLIPSLGPSFQKGILARCQAGDIEGLLHLLKESEAMLSGALRDDPAMRQARDAAFIQLCKHLTGAALAHWLDSSLGSANAVLACKLLAFLEERKQTFLPAYQRALAHRLLFDTYSTPLEEAVIAELRCQQGAGFSQPLERMLADVQPLPAEPKEKRLRKDSSYSLRVLSKATWPIDIVQGTEHAILPASFTQLANRLEAEYKKKHARRKLYWHPLLSCVQAEIMIGEIIYDLTCSALQLTVLEALSYAPQVISAVCLKTGLDASVIHTLLGPAVKLGLVEGLRFNPAFRYPGSHLDLTLPFHHAEQEDAVLPLIIGPDHAASNTHILQAAIMRHMKLVLEAKLSQIAQQPFASDREQLEKALESLVARDFLRLQNHDTYIYLP